MNRDNGGLTLLTEHHDDVSVLKFTGDICLSTLDDAKEALQKEIDSGYKLCVLDLDEVEFMDSSGIGFLLGALKRVKEIDGALRISRLSAYLTGLFRLLQLNEILEISDSVESAVTALRQPQRKTAETP